MRASNQDFVDYYRVLGVHQEATQQEIREAFRREAMRWHPDRNPLADAAEKIRLVNEAWEVLGDAVRKTMYDAELKAQSTPRHRPNPSHPNESHLDARRRDARSAAGTPAPTEISGFRDTVGRGAYAGLLAVAPVAMFLPGMLVGLGIAELVTLWSGEPFWHAAVFPPAQPVIIGVAFSGFSAVTLIVMYFAARNEGENSLHRLVRREETLPRDLSMLVQAGESLADRNAAGETPLTVAVKSCAPANVLRVLADPAAIARSRSALYWLIANCSDSATELAKIEALIEAGLLERGRLWPVRWLVEQIRVAIGADRDRHERWKLYRGLELHALLSRHRVDPHTVEILVVAGASLAKRDGNGRTPLEIALEMRHPRAIVELLSP